MKIRFLGVGAALNTSNMGSSVLVDDTVLIDVPPATSMSLLRDGIDIKNINHIFISHLHGDHYFGLPFLLLEYMLAKRSNPLYIYGSDELRNNTIELLRLAFPESDPEKLVSFSNSSFGKLSVGDSVSTDSFDITPVYAKHSIETFGFIIKSSTDSIYYSSDTELTEEIRSSIEMSRVVIIDSTTRGMTLAGHIDLEKVVEFAKKFKDKTFYITHRSRYPFADIDIPNIIFPNDGDEFNI